MWPLNNAIATIALRSEKPAAARPLAVSDGADKPSWGPLTPAGIKGMHLGDAFYFAVGLCAWWLTWPDMKAAAQCPALDASFATSWVGLVVLRNVAINGAIYEFWHQLLFGALVTESVKMKRYSDQDPYEHGRHILRERFCTLCGFLWSSAYECAIVHLWARGRLPSCGAAEQDLRPAQLLGGGCLMEDPASLKAAFSRPVWVAWFVLACPLITQFRGVHFFFLHRIMHPWWDRKNGLAQGDVGAFLYRWVHSLHHKSYSPGPWSSLSMHPVEHLLYFSCFLTALVLPTHPLHLLLCKYHTDISALAGHDGYGPPGADDVGHYLHHAHFECNYGFSFPNFLDRAYGTYEDGSSYAKKAKKAA